MAQGLRAWSVLQEYPDLVPSAAPAILKSPLNPAPGGADTSGQKSNHFLNLTIEADRV